MFNKFQKYAPIDDIWSAVTLSTAAEDIPTTLQGIITFFSPIHFLRRCFKKSVTQTSTVSPVLMAHMPFHLRQNLEAKVGLPTVQYIHSGLCWIHSMDNCYPRIARLPLEYLNSELLHISADRPPKFLSGHKRYGLKSYKLHAYRVYFLIKSKIKQTCSVHCLRVVRPPRASLNRCHGVVTVGNGRTSL